MMISVAISKEWFDEIKADVEYSDAFYYVECGKECVEVDVNKDQFNRVSAEKGWI